MNGDGECNSCQIRWIWRSGRLVWSKGWRSPGARATHDKWIRWTHATAVHCYDDSTIKIVIHIIILPRRRPHHVLILSVCLSVQCLHLEGKRKGLRIPNLVGRVPGTPAPPGPISRSRGQRSRSLRLIALLAKNPHNFAACCPINLIFGKWRKDPLPPCRPRKPQNSTHILNCKDGPIVGGPSTAAPSC